MAQRVALTAVAGGVFQNHLLCHSPAWYRRHSFRGAGDATLDRDTLITWLQVPPAALVQPWPRAKNMRRLYEKQGVFKEDCL